MSLPKTKHPTFEVVLPSTKKTITYRQMLVSDEKILLLAKESEDEAQIYRAVKQVVNNCIFDADVNKMTISDIQFLFLKIRSVSVGNIIELSFTDKQDEQDYKFEINLDEVTVTESTVPDVVKIDTEEGEGAIKLRYPPATLYDDSKALDDQDQTYEYIASKCIEAIYVGDDVHNADEYSDEELLDYVMNLDTKTYDTIKDFISNMPRLNYVIEYKNSSGADRKIVLSTLTDFFTF